VAAALLGFATGRELIVTGVGFQNETVGESALADGD
jgi:hypothetical protein